MAFGNKNDQAAMSEINVTPLVDVMLVLLVVFIVTAPLLTQSIGVNLPKTVAAAAPSQNPVTMVSIEVDGGIYLDKKKLDANALGQKLGELVARNPELTVQFEVDEGIPYGKAAEVLAIAQQAGITKLSLLTRPR